MRTLQALGVMALMDHCIHCDYKFGLTLVNIINEPWYWALGTALLFIIMIIGNFWIFFAIGKEEPWDWVKGKESGEARNSSRFRLYYMQKGRAYCTAFFLVLRHVNLFCLVGCCLHPNAGLPSSKSV